MDPSNETQEEDVSEGLVRVDESDFWDAEGDAARTVAMLDQDENTSVSTVSSAASSEPMFLLPELANMKALEDLERSQKFHDAMDDHDQWYGNPLTPEKAMDLFPPSEKGLVWKAEVIPNKWWQGENNTRLQNGLRSRDFDVSNRIIKAHRGTLPLTQHDLMSSLTETPDGRFIFHGRLNGWPQLTVLELISLERKRPLLLNKAQYSPHWKSSDGKPPVFEESVIYRACLRGPGWTSVGWSEASPGYCFWFEPLNAIPHLTYGTNLLHTVNDQERVAMVHMVNHRYAKLVENPRDKITYHSVVLLEWDHGRFCTVVEGAYLNGIGGYGCKSNWYEDKCEPGNLLSQFYPDEMLGPWISEASEIRCYDIPQKNLEEFKDYLQRHKGKDGRFLDPTVTFSHPARLSFRTKRALAQYLLNYVGRDCSYQELRTNCQTFAADLCAFLAGKRRVDPFHPLVKMEYKDRTYQFLYDSTMYTKTRKQK